MADYIARVSAKGGKKLHITESYSTRKEAARAAFIAKPDAKLVSTCIVHEGNETHRDIQWHNKEDIMKQKTNEGKRPQKAVKQPVREGIAYLIEDVMQKSEVVLAAQGIVDTLQKMAEDLSTMEAKEIMPLYDSLVTAFGPAVADQFNNAATEQVRNLITAVQGAKSALDQEILRMKKGVEGGDMSDVGMDSMDDVDNMNTVDDGGTGMDAPPGSPVPPASGGLPEVPTGPEDEAPDEMGAMGGGFAGRARKESAKPRGKKISEKKVEEDFLSTDGMKSGRPGGGPPAIDKHPHKSINFAPNLHNLAIFHGPSGKLATKIENMIDSEALSGEERTALANTLSHFAGFASEPAHWADAETKLNTTLQGAGLWDTKGPAVAKIVNELRKLAHLISFKHEGMIESAIKQLKNSADPDGLIFRLFRTHLAETRDAQTAAIRTARTYAIDIEDIVTIVREAAKDRDRYGAVAVREAGFVPFKKGHNKKDADAEDDKEPVEEAEEEDCSQCHGTGKVFPNSNFGREKKCVKCNGTGKKKAVTETADAKEAPAKKKWEKPWLKKEEVSEDDQEVNNSSLFPIGTGTTWTPERDGANPQQTGQPTGAGPSVQSTAPVGGQNMNPSTRSAMTPADMRARQQTQMANNQSPNARNTAPPPTGGATMVPPSESEQGANVPASSQTRMAPTNNVQRRPQFQQRQQ
jgi:hypothetical protein